LFEVRSTFDGVGKGILDRKVLSYSL